MQVLDIGIAGAGVAGLAAAALLARDGHRVTVFDRFDAPAPVGSGLMIQPMGLAVLEALGLAEGLIARAAPIRRLFGRSQPAGRVILDVRYRRGAVGFGVQRAALFDLLLEGALDAGVQLVPSTRITGADGRYMVAGNGRHGPFDLILDTMGFASPLCPRPARPLAFGALWGLVDWPDVSALDPAALEQRYRRASRMVGVLPVGRYRPDGADRLTFFWSLRERDYDGWRTASLDGWKSEAAALWPEVAPVLERIGAHDELTFARYGHRTLGRPVTGRIAHLGDSFHATSPQLGQGANMALLDAAVFASAVAAASSAEDALAAYARGRRLHVFVYQGASWLFTPLYQSGSRFLPWVRDVFLGPLSQVPPSPAVLAALVAGRVGRPLRRVAPEHGGCAV